MNQCTVLENELICLTDPSEVLTKEEESVISVVSLFNEQDYSFQVCVDREKFNMINVEKFLNSGCIENVKYKTRYVGMKELVEISDYSPRRIRNASIEIDCAMEITDPDLPNQHIVMLMLRKQSDPKKFLISAKHYIER